MTTRPALIVSQLARRTSAAPFVLPACLTFSLPFFSGRKMYEAWKKATPEPSSHRVRRLFIACTTPTHPLL